MKKFLLVLFTLPFLLNAQNVTMNLAKEKPSVRQMMNDRRVEGRTTVTKKTSFVKQMMKDFQAESRVTTYAGTEKKLPDSLYVYYGEEKEFIAKVFLTYDENGRIVQQLAVIDYDGDGIPDEEEKIEYVYTQKGDQIEVEEIYSYFIEGKWEYDEKFVSLYNSDDLYSPVEYYEYYYNEDKWDLDWKRIATEFDEKGRPIVIIETTTWDEDDVNRQDITYNENGLFNLIIYSELKAEDTWEPYGKREFFYDEDGKLTKEVYSYYWYNNDMLEGEKEWVVSNTIEYEYDENGNKARESFIEEEWTETFYYTYFYSSSTGNDVIFSVQSSIYPNPVSDVLNVTLEDADNAVISLVNAAGSVMVQQKTSKTVTSIPVQSFAKGYYFLIVQTSKGVKTHTVIIR